MVASDGAPTCFPPNGGEPRCLDYFVLGPDLSRTAAAAELCLDAGIPTHRPVIGTLPKPCGVEQVWVLRKPKPIPPSTPEGLASTAAEVAKDRLQGLAAAWAENPPAARDGVKAWAKAAEQWAYAAATGEPTVPAEFAGRCEEPRFVRRRRPRVDPVTGHREAAGTSVTAAVQRRLEEIIRLLGLQQLNRQQALEVGNIVRKVHRIVAGERLPEDLGMHVATLSNLWAVGLDEISVLAGELANWASDRRKASAAPLVLPDAKSICQSHSGCELPRPGSIVSVLGQQVRLPTDEGCAR